MGLKLLLNAACALTLLGAACSWAQQPQAAPEPDDGVEALERMAPAKPPSKPLAARFRNHEHRTRRELHNVDAHVLALLPYSALATEVYCNALYEPDRSAAREDCGLAWSANDLGWQRLAMWPDDLQQPHNFRGMRFGVYWRTLEDPSHVELGIAFRGTDFSSPADWKANLRWFHFGRTQYDVLAEIAPELIRRSKAEVAQLRPVTRWRVVTTGHSLGGGLAQLLAYKSKEVHAAVVFDPTPVTGYHSCVSDAEVNCHVPVWRVYERGEVLEYLRAFTRLFYPLSENITEIEFNLLRGNFVANHSMGRFHERLLEHMKDNPQVALMQPQDLFVARLDCTCARERRQFSWHLVEADCEALAQRRQPEALPATVAMMP